MMQMWCKIWIFLTIFLLASLDYLIIKQKFKNQYYFTKIFNKTFLYFGIINKVGN